MTFQRPGYNELFSRIQGDLLVLPSVLREPLAAALARVAHGEYGYLDWIHQQCSPLTCDIDRLHDWATLYSVDRLLAVQAVGTVFAAGNSGTQVLAGTLLKGSNGLYYTVLSATTLTSNPTILNVRCNTVGYEGNLGAGAVLVLVDPILGCSSQMMVSGSGISGGADDEDVEDWRARVVAEWIEITQNGGRSGKTTDYVFWAKSAHPSVTTALVIPHGLGVGTVVVKPICNGLQNRLPTVAVIDAVIAKIANKAPATADVKVGVPIVHDVNVTIHLLSAVDTIQTRNAINQALANVVFAEQSETSVLQLSEVNAAIATVTTQYTLLSPNSDIQVNMGELLVLANVNYQ